MLANVLDGIDVDVVNVDSCLKLKTEKKPAVVKIKKEAIENC